ncbi:MAG: SGNH/GDSL hydrolase family protein [Gemmatimonadaceae bacterium]
MLLVISFSIALLICEVGLRIAGFGVILPIMFVTDSATYYSLKPGAHERSVNPRFFDYRWTTNLQGFRGTEEYAVPKPGGVRRVLMLGDSFTFGVAANDSETYPAILQQMLQATCQTQVVQVVNGGVGGFGTSQELARLESRGVALQPDVVVVGFLRNDPLDDSNYGVHEMHAGIVVEKKGASRPHFGPVKAQDIPGYAWLTSHSALLNLVRAAYAKAMVLRQSPAARRGDDVGPEGDTMGITGEDDPERRWMLTELLFARMRENVVQGGGRLIVAIIPELSEAVEAYQGNRDSLTVAREMGMCKSAQIECIDIASWWVEHYPQQDPRKLYIPGEYHPTKRGYQLIATAIEEPVRRALDCDGAPDLR